MNLPPADLMRNLALGQALLVAPALGESYAAKTAQTIAAVLLLVAQDMETFAARRARFGERLAALLAGAHPADVTLAHDLQLLARSGTQPDAHFARLLQGLVVLHQWADTHDPELAHACRAFLADWTAAELLAPPGLPAA
ncbi:MAG: hypothetical protein SNJ79_14475 [Sphingomonadaceae bacterium]